MKLVIIGCGYVGLVSGVCLAAAGHDVTCLDTNAEITRKINEGVSHIHERGLDELLRNVLDAGRFRAASVAPETLMSCDAVIVAVGTPSGSDGSIDLAAVRAAAREIGAALRQRERRLVVIVKSTVVPGTTDTIVRGEIEAASGRKLGDFGLGMNPEFLREGEAVEDFMNPDRIVLGHEDPLALRALQAIYEPWSCDKLEVNCRTAELIKYANNALLATQISAVNEIANLAAAVGGIDVMDVMRGVHLDKRWNPVHEGARMDPQILTYLVPGCGFGGSCFPKDVQALRALGVERGLPMHMLNAVLSVNEAQPRQVADILERESGSLAGKRCLVLGLAFKPGTDDVRESPALKIVASLLERGARVTTHDPVAIENFRRALGPAAERVTFTQAWLREVDRADILIVATRWPEYEELSALDLGGRTLFDARRLLSPVRVPTARYVSIGRRGVAAVQPPK